MIERQQITKLQIAINPISDRLKYKILEFYHQDLIKHTNLYADHFLNYFQNIFSALSKNYILQNTICITF